MQEFAKLRAMRANVLVCQDGLRANVPKVCTLLIFPCQRVNKRANMSYGVQLF